MSVDHLNFGIFLAPFHGLARESRETNEGRKADRSAIHAEMAEVTRAHPTAELLPLLREAGIVVSAVHGVAEARDLSGVREHLTRTELPDGTRVNLPPTAVDTGRDAYRLAPGFGEHTRTILEESGLASDEIDDLVRRGVVH